MNYVENMKKKSGKLLRGINDSTILITLIEYLNHDINEAK